MKKRDERLAELSEKLAELSAKAQSASDEAKAAREKRQEQIQDAMDTAKGNVVAFEEKVKEAGEESKTKASTALLKAKMTIGAKAQDVKDNVDKAHLEFYMDDRIITAIDCLNSADYLIANALVCYYELLDAAIEYDERFGEEEEA